MGDEERAPGGVSRDLIEVVEAVLEKTGVPDAIKPPATEFGEAARPGGKAIGETFSAVSIFGKEIVVGSIAYLTHGWHYVRDFIMEDLPRRLKHVPKERIVAPRPIVAVPAIEAIRLVGGEPELRAMFANLLAASMDSRTATQAHPAFVEIIKQMVPEEARLFAYLAKIQFVPLVTRATITSENPPQYDVASMDYITSLAEDASIPEDGIGTHIHNITRLGLIFITRDHALNPSSEYDRLLTSEAVRSFEESMRKEGKKPVIFKHVLGLTNIGIQFSRVCLSPG